MGEEGGLSPRLLDQPVAPLPRLRSEPLSPPVASQNCKEFFRFFSCFFWGFSEAEVFPPPPP